MLKYLKKVIKKIKCKCNMLCCCNSKCSVNNDDLNNIPK